MDARYAGPFRQGPDFPASKNLAHSRDRQPDDPQPIGEVLRVLQARYQQAWNDLSPPAMVPGKTRERGSGGSPNRVPSRADGGTDVRRESPLHDGASVQRLPPGDLLPTLPCCPVLV